ncbi:hypothetical protein OJ253_2203 [Cryptosporidium canis]|uniref:Uncharacterized protein n=1 Tax=Cryptosporidium canis TaxID=195482 RepID=A0A9D5DGR3_9CRYT|nr:hypothetical protein OJ253_2203 [Cryptosporidium canis]
MPYFIEESDSIAQKTSVPVIDNWEDLLNSDNDDYLIGSGSENPPGAKVETLSSMPIEYQKDYEEQRRCQELVEEMDESVMDDLFDGFVEPSKTANKLPGNNQSHTVSNLNQQDAIGNLNLSSYGKVEAAALKIAESIKPALAKSPAWLRFIDICLNEIFQKLDLKDLKTLKKKIDNQLSIREKEEREKSQQKKKPNNFSSLSKNFREELDIFDGVDSLDESDDY